VRRESDLHSKHPQNSWSLQKLQGLPTYKRPRETPLPIFSRYRRKLIGFIRDIELALYGAIERAKKEGRSVPLVQLPGNHCAVQRSIRRLLGRFFSDGRVSFLLLHNTGFKDVKGKAFVVSDRELAPRGALHYSKRHEDYYAEAAREIEALNPA
jgi:hypothetical protein